MYLGGVQPRSQTLRPSSAPSQTSFVHTLRRVLRHSVQLPRRVRRPRRRPFVVLRPTAFVHVVRRPRRPSRPLCLNWKIAIVSSSPLIFLGFFRLVTTTGVDYQVHTSEYGVHWNFFFTLAAISILTSFINIPPKYSGVFGSLVLVGYQFSLMHGLNHYLLSSERGMDIISQNKEGIFSIFGYWGMYLIGVHLGNYLIFGTHSSALKSSRWVRTRVWVLAILFWNSTFCPLRYTNWSGMPNDNKNRFWRYTNRKFILPVEARDWIETTVREAWRRYKHKIKKNHFLKYSNMTERLKRLKNHPPNVPIAQFKSLCAYWSKETIQAISENNTRNRAQLKWMHRMGPKNFALTREKTVIQQCNPQINIESIEYLLGLSHGDANSSPKDIRPQMHSSTSTHAPCHGKQCINEDVEKDDINDKIQEDDINDKIQEDDLNDKIQEDDVDDEFQEDDIDLDDEFQEEDIDGEFQEDDVDEEFMEDDISNEFQEDDLDALLLEDKLE
ncbi:unnamed protein product [Vicia faba]|uniref:Uncharacterized protein n=1 Tax=Vicia faba TaxID=3906 RepID=A0AAV0ZK29_VICFA|nr:unnamed protein product [Vicia faba]